MKPQAMGNIGELGTDGPFDDLSAGAPHSGIGCASTLPMTDEERAAARPRPIGFVYPQTRYEPS